MPKVRVNGVSLHYDIAGKGKETIVFSHGLLFNHTMFENQIEILKEQYQCIAYDHRGQGNSQLTKNGYDMDNLAQDALGLLDAILQAKAAMESDYDEIEEEPYERELAGIKLEGISLSFVYLDLIVSAHLFEMHQGDRRYFVQIQAEDRDMTKLEKVFDAMLLSICQGAAKVQ